MSKLKRILALVICCIMVLTVFVSCGEDEVDESREYLKTHNPPEEKEYVTLNLYIPCNFEVNDDSQLTIESMQKEFNRVIEEKYRTRIIFKFVEEADYAAKLAEQRETAMNSISEPLSKLPTTETDVYPREESFQLDIFVATGLDMVEEFIKEDALMNLTTDLGVAEAGKESYYIEFCNQNSTTSLPTVIYDNAVLNGVRYGVPANFKIGEYKYYYIKEAEADILHFKKNGTVADIESRVSELRTNIQMANSELKPGDVLYVEDDIIKTSLGPTDNAEEYLCYIKESPLATEEDIFDGMFCIAASCRYKDRALEVINELYNNIDLHTTLQYGSQALTYKLEYVGDTKIVVAKENAPVYSINPRYTGNICMLYASDSVVLPFGQNATIIITSEYIKEVYKQNCDAVFESIKG